MISGGCPRHGAEILQIYALDMIDHIRILIVDRDASLVEMLRRFLKTRGYTVEAHANEQKALDALRRDVFDLLACNAPAAGENGGSALHQAHALRPGMGILLMTDERSRRCAALKAGADDSISKPFTLSAFTCALERAYGRALSRQEECEEMPADVDILGRPSFPS